MLPRFRCLFPRSKEEALRLLKDEPNAKILAGGTDLLVDIRKFTCCPETLLDITRVKDLQWGYDKASHCLSPISTHAFVAQSNEIRARFSGPFPCMRICGFPSDKKHEQPSAETSPMVAPPQTPSRHFSSMMRR